MKITKITPRGFCKGVIDAWAMSKKIRQENPNKDIYMIGWLVHNKEMIKDLESIGIKTIDDSYKSRYEIIKKLKPSNNTILIFSAHGSEQKALDLASQKGFEYYDATCIYVDKTKEIIKQKINEGYEIIFIGKNNHPETKAMLSIDDRIIFIENIEDAKKIKINQSKKYLVTNQTTISIYDFYEIHKYLKHKINLVKFENEICNATFDRQKAIDTMDKSIDLLIVVGDKKSNNSNKLVEIALKNNVESYLIENENCLNDSWFLNKKHVAISSGTSTPTWLTNKIIKIIEDKWGNDEK